MSLVIFQHESFETPSQLGRILMDYGHRLRVVKLREGQPVPADLDDVDGVISMGGTMNVDQQDQFPFLVDEMAYLRQAHEANLPMVGVCLGAQLIAAALGGKVAAMDKPEIGWAPVKLAFPGTIDTLYTGIGWTTTQFHFHGQQVTDLPPGSVPLAGSSMCKHQAFRLGFRTYAFQYHFEWTLEDIKRFVALPFVTEHGYDPAQILADCAENYDDYRRLGDRLCHNLATYVFPIDKRRVGGL